MIKKYISVILCILLLSPTFLICAEEGEEIPSELRATIYDYTIPNDSGITTLSQNVLLYCDDTDTVLYHVNDKVLIEPGACVKVMVGAVALKLYRDRLTQEVEITSSHIEGAFGLSMNLDLGEKIRISDLIYAVMLIGANDAALTLARLHTGNVSDFVDEMNACARLAGATNTTYKNVTGFHEDGMLTTLSDTVKIARYASQIEGFSEITSCERYIIPETNKSSERTLWTRNCLLSRYRDTRYKTADVTGMLYGSTAEAGQCLVASFKKNDMTYFLAITGGYVTTESDKRLTVFEDALKLISHAENDFLISKIVSVKKACGEASIRFNSTKTTVELVPTDDVLLYIPKRLSVKKDLDYDVIVYEKCLDTPVTKGQLVGRLDVAYDGNRLFTVPLAIKEDVERNEILYFLDMSERLTENIAFRAAALSFVALLALWGCISGLFSYLKKKKKRKRRLR